MVKLLIIRTGETEYECQGRVQGTLNIPLSEDGRLQIERLAEQLHDQQIDAAMRGPVGRLSSLQKSSRPN